MLMLLAAAAGADVGAARDELQTEKRRRTQRRCAQIVRNTTSTKAVNTCRQRLTPLCSCTPSFLLAVHNLPASVSRSRPTPSGGSNIHNAATGKTVSQSTETYIRCLLILKTSIKRDAGRSHSPDVSR